MGNTPHPTTETPRREGRGAAAVGLRCRSVRHQLKQPSGREAGRLGARRASVPSSRTPEATWHAGFVL